MPYSSNGDLPEPIREALPTEAQDIFRAAFNSAYEGTCKDSEDIEACAMKVAWSAVSRVFEKGDDGTWKKKSNREDSAPDISNDTGNVEMPAHPGSTPRIRALAQPFKKNQLIMQEDGSLLIKGVPMLAAGTWTDSAVGTPLYYPEKTLSEYATNWHDTTGWSRHLGGVPRDITEKVAEARELRYENGAIVADILVHGATQKSRDTIELVKRKLISFVSVEHGGKEEWNPETRQMEAKTLDFYGFAFVNKGACKLCRINESKELAVPSNPSNTKIGEDASTCKLTQEQFGDMPFSEIRKRFAYDGNAPGEENFSELKLPHHSVDGTVRPNCVRAALQAIGGALAGGPMYLGSSKSAVIAHLEKHLKEINDREQAERMDEKEITSHIQAAIQAAMAPVLKELETIKSAPNPLEPVVAELKRELETIKNTPVPPVTQDVKESPRELGEVETYVVFDRRNKIARID